MTAALDHQLSVLVRSGHDPREAARRLGVCDGAALDALHRLRQQAALAGATCPVPAAPPAVRRVLPAHTLRRANAPAFYPFRTFYVASDRTP